MGLEEQFKRLFPHQTEEYLDYEESLQCAIIAENFAIGFAEFCRMEDMNANVLMPIKELLEIYKKTL